MRLTRICPRDAGSRSHGFLSILAYDVWRDWEDKRE